MQQHRRNAATMLVELDDEHTKCSICFTNFSSDRNNNDQKIRQHLPVLSSSQRCDHWFCHGCVLREQLRVAEENNGRIPKWIKCMHCREKTSFNPAEPKYHRLLIDLLVRAQKYAAVHLKNEELEQEKSVGEQLDSGRAKSIKREVDAVDDDEYEDVQLGSGNNVVCKKNECDAVDDDEEEREVKRPKTLTQSPPLVKVKEEPVEWDDQYDPRPLLESAFTNETSQSAATADCTNNQLDGRMPIVYLGYLVPGFMNSFSGVAADEQKKKRRTDRITAAPITITQVSETTKKVGEEGKFISDDEDGAKKTEEGERGTAAAATSAKRRSPPKAKESALAGLKAPPELTEASVIREGGARELTEPSAKTDSTRPQDQTALTCKQISTSLNHQLPSKTIVHLCKAPSCPKFRQGSCKGYCTECFRQRNIHLRITLLEHASRCTAATCNSSNCLKMKSYLRHDLRCTVRASGGCKTCKCFWGLLRIHAKQCKSKTCPIPQCIAIRKRIRQLQQKQQAMPDVVGVPRRSS